MYSYVHLYHVYTDNINCVENMVQVNFMATHYITKLNITTKLAISINYKQTINTVTSPLVMQYYRILQISTDRGASVVIAASRRISNN